MRKLLKSCIIIILVSLNYLTFSQSKQLMLNYDMIDANNYSIKCLLIDNSNTRLFITMDPRKDGNQIDSTGQSYDYKVYNDKWSRIFYQKGKINIIRFPIYGSSMTYQFPKDSIKITLTKEKKVILNFNCQKAILIKGNRIYDVWFTMEIPGMYYPYGLAGTPGTIVEVTNNQENFKIKLTGINKNIDLNKFNKYNEFIIKQNVLSFFDYKKKISNLLTNTKKENYALLKQMEATVTYKEDQSHFTNQIIDIPHGLVKKLQNITQ